MSNPDKTKASDKRYYDKNVEKVRDKGRFGRIRNKYFPNLTVKQTKEKWYTMFDAQQGLCAVFGCQEPLEVDHRHSDGKIRDLLCNDCNTALARIKEDPKRALALIEYIKKHK